MTVSPVATLAHGQCSSTDGVPRLPANELVSFWHGPIGWMEHMCIRSMLDTDHRLTVYMYEPQPIAPGVIVRDAGEILPRDSRAWEVLAVDCAQFADVFRYEMLAKGVGIWTDLDFYFLKNLGDQPESIYCWEKPGRINNAILRLPARSAELSDLLAFVHRRPLWGPWWRPKHKVRQAVSIALGRPMSLAQLPKAQFGPKALTYYLGQHGKQHLAQPSAVFYPVAPQDHADLLGSDPACRESVEQRITDKTIAVHLWANGMRKALQGSMPDPGSYLGRLYARSGVLQT
ncbi:MAG: hypothetical protein ACKVP3_10185 [Hyphomicrobiaceae bacterium]